MPRPSKAAGSVALVTGANRGIGLAFVRELAALFLSSITRSELADQGTEVTALIVGSVDTRMAAHVQGRKEDPRDIVRAGLDAVDRGEHVADTDFMAIDARARYARDPARYERGMTKLLKATVMETGR
jgi:NAD(P)-dependent dehydrogenase (short-subunit alcohol dehydrogenase family)